VNGTLDVTRKLSNLALRAIRGRRRPIDVDLDPPSREEDSEEGFDDLSQAQRRALRSLGGSTARSLAISLREERERDDRDSRRHREELARAIERLAKTLRAAGYRLRAASSPAVGSLQPLILLVDDQPSILRIFERYVSNAGWRSHSCSNLADVKAALEAGLVPSLVATDLVLGKGETGVAIKDFVGKRLPETPVLFVSGYDAVGTMTHPVLPKACSAEKFIATIRRLVENKTSSLHHKRK
jgi:CheY-like chemotaxis protein